MTPEESSPWLRRFPEDAFVTWVIYDHPLDYPQGYLLRAQYVKRGSMDIIPDTVAWYADDPEKLRAIIPPPFIKYPARDPNPVILEQWI